MSNGKKSSFDIAVEQLAANYQKKKDNNIGKTILNAVTLPEPVDKIPVFVDISKLYESPADWNFFKKVNIEKMAELKQSIRDNDLLYPIQVWNINKSIMYQDDNTYIDNYHLTGNDYMILAGHNRTLAYMELYEETGDEKYLKIPAFIYAPNELTIQLAKNIIVDTNYVQRKLTQEEIVKSVLWKYANYDDSQEGNKKDNIAKSMNLPPTTSFRYYKIGLLAYPIQKLIYNKAISADYAIKLGNYSEQLQLSIADKLTNEKLKNMPKNLTEEGVYEYFFEKEDLSQILTMKISYDVPIKYADEFKTHCDEYLEYLNNKNIE